MADIPRIPVEDAYRKIRSGQALLVCAYDDEEKCRRFNLDGSMSLAGFEPKVSSLSKTQEIIFY